ncbi:uncharacterized protein LOC131647909 isoform X1 [Vicia villosa]|uniref:uncharacterized protein LOC131647909 isoform X1 n=1 Tax=Vicia villosa TaxID=3911 RepID=UPI00273AF720|nr:uncharacterized protein LOC131647909 isoform X1 [Vicia villosa]
MGCCCSSYSIVVCARHKFCYSISVVIYLNTKHINLNFFNFIFVTFSLFFRFSNPFISYFVLVFLSLLLLLNFISPFHFCWIVQREEIFGSFRYGISIFWWVGWETFMNVAFGWINVKDVANAHILANGHALDNGRYCLVERVIHFSKLKLMETNMGMLLYGRIISYLEFLSMKRDFLVRLCWRHAP